MKSINKKIKQNYFIITALLIIGAIAIIGRAFYISLAEGSEWRKIGDAQIRPNIKVPATRGNIYSADGQLMATTESHYRLYMDFWSGVEVEKMIKKTDQISLDDQLKKTDGVNLDTLKKYLPVLAVELNKILPQRSVEQYKSDFMKGIRMREKETEEIKKAGAAGWKNVSRRSREYRLSDLDVNYIQLKKIQKMPYFSKGKFKSGLYYKELVKRTKPYGTLASRTIGDIYGEFGKGGKNGLELQYDSLLRGEPGTSTRQKVNGRIIDIIDVRPVNGKDIISTIDINIQDITEKTLLAKLKEIDAESGTAVVMEVATGEIKAITNMGRIREGVWTESKNYAVSDLSEPGSTFKVVSMMVALEDGLVQPDDSVGTGNGLAQIAGHDLKDHNYPRGYGTITAAKSIRYSSNIGVSKLIMKAYSDNPSRYVEGIYRIGIDKDLQLEIPGYAQPKIRHPKNAKQYWSKTTLPWMSFGYETQVPPISTLTFFNAIANDGKMVKPLFVKEIQANGETIEKKKPQVINPSICSKRTLEQIRQMLDDVVNQPDGTGKPARSDYFHIAGKTGTAQISQGAAGYRAGGLSHQVSFCGYFPVENPRYSCIVVIRNPRNGSASGGFMCGKVFKAIAEEMYAKNLFPYTNPFPVDTIHPVIPKVKHGLVDPSQYALKKLDITHNDSVTGKWATASWQADRVILKNRNITGAQVPNTIGMGAKDAVYALESAGLQVRLAGRGTVAKQSIDPGAQIMKGQTISIELK
jgi:cell division protein FtsI (penicillin-binding protein 3)